MRHAETCIRAYPDISGQRGPRSACASAQADQGLHCPLTISLDKTYYFIVSGEISVYLMKIKVESITSELISYHFTIVNDTIYIFTLRFGRLRFSSLFQKWMLPPLQIFEHLFFVSELNYQVLVCNFFVRM